MNIRAALVVALAVAGVAAPSAAGHHAGAGGSLRFGFVPQRAFQGREASVSVLVRSTRARCRLAVRYVDGSLQGGLAQVRPVKGRVAWTWSIAQAVPAGAARVTVSCGKAGSLAGRFLVVGGTTIPSKLAVVDSGWSQRPDRAGPGSSVSFGIRLSNPAPSRDARDVSVLVNAVGPSGFVLGTTTSRIAAVGAGSVFNLGGSVHLPDQTPVARLEIVAQTGAYVAHELHQPAVENLQIVPGSFEPSWVGGVHGEVVNDDPVRTLTSARLSVVLLDAAGKIVGGSTGFVLAKLPPGTRSFFSASSGVSAVPTASAATAVVSVEPVYAAPGA